MLNVEQLDSFVDVTDWPDDTGACDASERLEDRMAWVGDYHVSTSADIRAFLSKQGRDHSVDMIDQAGEFHMGALNCGLTARQRRFVLSHFQKFASCKVCTSVPCPHFPELKEMPEDLLLKVPVVTNRSGDVVVSAYVLPVATILRSWFADPLISNSLVVEKLDRQADLGGNSSFCSGLYFSELLQRVPSGSIPVCLGAYSDGTTVVNVGIRSWHVASIALMNSTLSVLDTVRPVMFIPRLKDVDELKGLGDEALKRLKRRVFHAVWEVVMQTAATQDGDSLFGFGEAEFQV